MRYELIKTMDIETSCHTHTHTQAHTTTIPPFIDIVI